MKMNKEKVFPIVVVLATMVCTFIGCWFMDKYDVWPKEPFIKLASREVIIVGYEL